VTLSEFCKALKTIRFTRSHVLVLTSCNLGNFTKLDTTGGESLVQAVANAMNCVVISPGGFSSGSTVATAMQLKTIATEPGMGTYHQMLAADQARVLKRGDTALAKEIGQEITDSFDSQSNCFYVTVPSTWSTWGSVITAGTVQPGPLPTQ
jgi:hypothetical protein